MVEQHRMNAFQDIAKQPIFCELVIIALGEHRLIEILRIGRRFDEWSVVAEDSHQVDVRKTEVGDKFRFERLQQRGRYGIEKTPAYMEIGVDTFGRKGPVERA